MKNAIDNSAKAQVAMAKSQSKGCHCNYSDNYYGDQVCREPKPVSE